MTPNRCWYPNVGPPSKPQEYLLKRTTGLSAIARAGLGKVLADSDARGYALAVLGELNVSTPIAFKHKEKGAAVAAMSLLAPSALQVCVRAFVGTWWSVTFLFHGKICQAALAFVKRSWFCCN